MAKKKQVRGIPPKGIERRRTRRRSILATFSIFMVIPKKGIHRLHVHNISEEGIAFDLDIESELPAEYPVESGDTIDARLYINPSLYIPISVQVVRIESGPAGRMIGAVFQNRELENYKAFLSLLQMLDKILDILKMENESV